MNQKIRKISLFLSLVTLLCLFASCKRDEPDGETGTVSTRDPVNDDGAPTPYMEDFEGYEFRVLTRGGESGWINNDIMGDVTGSSVDKAVAQRNAGVQAKYNFTITEHRTPEFNNVAATMAASGEDAYDMWSFMMRNMPQHGISGFLYDLREIEWLNVDATWYDQQVRETSTFGDYLFFLTGDLLYIDENATAALTFDHDKWIDLGCASEFGGRDLYTIVKDGDWTFEKLKMLAEMGTNYGGNGEPDPTDEWGFAFENATILQLNVGFGNVAMSKDRNDLFVVNDSQKQIDDYQDIQSFLTGEYATTDTGGNRAFIQYIWLQMLSFTDGDSTPWGDCDYAVIPFPKKDSQQDRYYSLVTTYGACGMAIPNTVADVNKVASIMDLISYESQQTVLPAYEEWLLAGRKVERSEDLEMLRIIMDGQVVDPAHLWLETGLYDALKNLVAVDNEGNVSESSIGSLLASVKTKVNATNQEFLEKLKKLY